MRNSKSMMMVAAALLALSFTGCRTIVHGKDVVTIQSAAQGVGFELLDGAGKVVASGTTPHTIGLNAQSFNGAYTIRFTNRAGEETSQELRGQWKLYPLDLIFAFHFVGVGYIVDLATGKAFYLPAAVNLNIDYD